jgi:sortase A
MRADRGIRLWIAIEWILVAVGVVCLARYAWMSYQIRQLESGNRQAVARMLAGREAPALAPGRVAPLPGDDLIGELDIPRLHVSAAVIAGDDAGALAGAVGYLPETAPPWAHGNTALAAHRDRLFRPLEEIRAGDQIRLSTRHGNFEYRVIRTLVVDPAEVWVLDNSPGVDLTLITCYPFVYVGHAPQRFIVRARKIDAP